MRIFEDKQNNISSRRASRCSYCRVEGHNVNECPNVKDDYEAWLTFQVPINSVTLQTARWFKNPKYWGEWYTKCQDAYHKQIAYKARQAKPKKSRAVSKRTCGFCGDADHTRRTCEVMKAFLQDCYKANENWRRAAYKYLVKDLGLSVGAIIKVKKEAYYSSSNDEIEKVATIAKINWDSLNLCAAKSWHWDQTWISQSLQITALIDGQLTNIGQTKPSYNSDGNITGNGSIIAEVKQGYSRWKFTQVLSRSPHELPEEWVTSYKQAFDYVVKKKTFEKLQEVGFVQLVDKWKRI